MDVRKSEVEGGKLVEFGFSSTPNLTEEILKGRENYSAWRRVVELRIYGSGLEEHIEDPPPNREEARFKTEKERLSAPIHIT